MDSQEQIVGSSNELAKERNRAAAERTIAAWINNCTTLVGFGLAINPIFTSLSQLLPDRNFSETAKLSHGIGLTFISLGTGLLIVAMVQHYLAVQSLERNDYVFIPSSQINISATIAILIFGCLAFVLIFLDLT